MQAVIDVDEAKVIPEAILTCCGMKLVCRQWIVKIDAHSVGWVVFLSLKSTWKLVIAIRLLQEMRHP